MGNTLTVFHYVMCRKVTSWENVKFDVVAENTDEALQKAVKLVDEGELLGDIEPDGDTIEYLSIEENQDNATMTIETIGNNSKVLWDNKDGMLPYINKEKRKR